MTSVETYTHSIKIIYSNEKGDVISYEASRMTNSLFVDDEEVTEKKVYILDTWVKVIEMQELTCLVWEDDAYIYTVSGNVDLKDNLIKMVERSVKIEQEN